MTSLLLKSDKMRPKQSIEEKKKKKEETKRSSKNVS